MHYDILILGSGLAGWSAIKELRKLDSTLSVALVSRDEGHFYAKPQLSNALSAAKSAAQLIQTDAATMASQQQVTLYAQVSVTEIDRLQKTVQLSDDSRLHYGYLVLACGADPIAHGLTGEGQSAIFAVNDLNDYTQFEHALASAQRLAILGGGLIGCEFANDVIRRGGVRVDVIDPGPQPLGRLLPTEAARFLQAKLADSGVNWHFGVKADAIEAGAEHGVRLRLSDGSTLDADCVLSAIGLRPRTALAAAAGLTVNRGIVTDAFLQTSDASIFALGDCAEVAGLNLPYVMPLMQAARALAATLNGTRTAVVYPAMPVIIKTPACPTVCCPPPMGMQGEWQVETDAESVRALFHDAAGQLGGFALLGMAVNERQALAKQLAPWLA